MVKRSRILLVEDDPTYRRLWEKLVEELGAEKFWPVASPEEAAAIMKTHPIDLLISDVVLPGLNGYELAKIARVKNPAVEILLTTGYMTDLSRFNLGRLRCHLLHKPYHNLKDVLTLLVRLANNQDLYAGMDEESFSENLDYPEITEWTL